MSSVAMTTQEHAYPPHPIVIVGAGPVGIRTMHELMKLLPEHPIVVYGEEKWLPYNRVQLSSILAGNKDWVEIITEMDHPNVVHFLGCPIVKIDRKEKTVTDIHGKVQPYHTLVLATGSTPYIPPITGVQLPGVYVFRKMDDALRLAECRTEAHQTVVIGGGLLGIEAAQAMLQPKASVSLIEIADHLMPKQIDQVASNILVRHIEELGIKVYLEEIPELFFGKERVEGIKLKSGKIIPCDTVILSTGVRPNVQLARDAHLDVNKGIKVDDTMMTSDANIFAVGECCEHHGQTYGFLAPGLEQAAVAAHVIAGHLAHYTVTTTASRLKLLSQPVFSMGEVCAEQTSNNAQAYRYMRGEVYRKVVMREGRVIGALAMGDWSCTNRIQESIINERPLWAWQLWLFERNGTLWHQPAADQVHEWPENAVVCNCTGVTRGRLTNAMESGCNSVAQLTACTGAGGVCGSCKPLLNQLVGGDAKREPVEAAGTLNKLAIVATISAAAALFLPGIPFTQSVAESWQWDWVWRNDLAKQASGYGLFALATLLAAISLRKRIKRFSWGNYPIWRVLHVAIGLAAITGFFVHTGGHMGEQLSALLTISFIGAALTGGFFATLIAKEHLISPVKVRRLKSSMTWAHILFLWPLPVLLAFHVARGYIF